MKSRLLFFLCFMLVALVPTLAQDAPELTPEAVEVEASDGLLLKGDLFRPETIPAEGAPTVVLLHELDSNRVTYNKIVPDFLAAGYIVLTVDLRGHGETGGRNDWVAAQTDTQTWLAWLREQDGVRDDQVAIIGASVGSMVAIMGCAQDPACATVIALSPVSRFPEFDAETAVSTDLAERSVLLIAGHRDTNSADAVRTLFAVATGKASAYMFPGGAHGTGFFGIKRDRTVTMGVILGWLAQEMPQPVAQ